MKKLNLFFAAMIIVLVTACASKKEKEAEFLTQGGKAIVTKEVPYMSGTQKMNGFLALPEGEGPFPAVLVVHEWWGQTEYPRERAKMLAKEGYAAFAVDMYGEGQTADHPKDAKAFSAKVSADMNKAEKSFRAALETLKNQPGVDKMQIAALGYCFGGGLVLEMARRGLDLKMIGSYHGDLTPVVKNKVGPMKARVLIFNGADDPFVSSEAVETSRKNLKAAKVRYKFINYKGAKHGFTNPGATAMGEKFSLPLVYNKHADEDSWKQTLEAFKIVFK